jgi:hypothetical protein
MSRSKSFVLWPQCPRALLEEDGTIVRLDPSGTDPASEARTGFVESDVVILLGQGIGGRQAGDATADDSYIRTMTRAAREGSKAGSTQRSLEYARRISAEHGSLRVSQLRR